MATGPWPTATSGTSDTERAIVALSGLNSLLIRLRVEALSVERPHSHLTIRDPAMRALSPGSPGQLIAR